MCNLRIINLQIKTTDHIKLQLGVPEFPTIAISDVYADLRVQLGRHLENVQLQFQAEADLGRRLGVLRGLLDHRRAVGVGGSVRG